MYEELLNPTLYKNSHQAFLEEVYTNSSGKEMARQLDKTILANDNIMSYLEITQDRARKKFEKSAIVFPTITIWHNDKWQHTVFHYPQTLTGVKKLVAFGKCLAFCSFSPFVFFSAMFPADEDGKRFGVSTIGTTVTGNSLIYVDNPQNVNGKMQFQHVTSDVIRKGQTRSAFGKMYDLVTQQEVERILKCLPKVCSRLKTNKERCAASFSATVWTMDRFGYNK
jgi:hypothetical protein